MDIKIDMTKKFNLDELLTKVYRRGFLIGIALGFLEGAMFALIVYLTAHIFFGYRIG